MDWWKDKVSSFHGSMGWDMDEKKRKDFLDQTNELMGDGWAQKHPDAFNTMLANEQSRSLEKRQKLFDIAATGGAQDGGPAIPGGGTSGIGYAPQRDITKTFPGAMSKEEEEYLLALRGPVPGMMTYRGMS
jgi:hypothetical protein